MATGRTRHFTDKQILDALTRTAGVLAAAARALQEAHGRSCTRQQISQRLQRSPKLTVALAEILETSLDIAESKLLAAIQGGESWAVQFMLKTKGKARGWSEKVEVEGLIVHEVIDNTPIESMTMQELDAYMAETEPQDLSATSYLVPDLQERERLLYQEKMRRALIWRDCERYKRYRRVIQTKCSLDVRLWFDTFVTTYDPRDMQTYPMVLWPIQRQYLDFIEEHIEAQRDWLVEKSRDMGATYLNCGFALHRWLYRPGFKTSMCANKSDLVDERGNPDAIFEKMRMILEGLPWWMKPDSFDRSRHALLNRLINPSNSNTIIGEGGSSAGRGGRSSVYVVDEAAHLDNADAVNAATSRNSRSRGWVSSANGMGNFFYERRQSGAVPVFRMHWRDHPLKDDAWAKAEQARLTKATFAAEDDIDYSASLPGLLIEQAWIDSAKELWKRLPHPTHHDTVAGLDVGAGKDRSVFQPRRGSLVYKAKWRQDGDTTDTANWALDLCRQYGTHLLVYDSVGVGEGVKSTLKRGWHELPEFRVVACAWGLPPVGRRTWQDGKTSLQKFRDIKAECWWMMREAFRNSHEKLLFMTDREGGIDHGADDCLLLEPNLDLERELPTVTWQTTSTGSKIEVESKEALARRGVKSPDFADALAYSFHTPVRVDFKAGVDIAGHREDGY